MSHRTGRPVNRSSPSIASSSGPVIMRIIARIGPPGVPVSSLFMSSRLGLQIRTLYLESHGFDVLNCGLQAGYVLHGSPSCGEFS